MNPFKKNNQWLICQPELEKVIDNQWFEQQHWLNQGRLLGANSGRGSAWIIKSGYGKPEHGKWILRHYFRGGLYSKVSKDQYFWTGVENCRAIKEFRLLAQLQRWELPSPKAIAARVSQHGMFYRNDLIMEQIMHQQTLGQFLIEKNKDINLWAKIGQTIAQFHNHGVYHSDLNAHNILINNDKVYLIDFDKGDIRIPHIKWQNRNIARLKRSIEKITNHSCKDELKKDWDALFKNWKDNLK